MGRTLRSRNGPGDLRIYRPVNRDVFIVHGHAHGDRDALVDIVRSADLNPRLLDREPKGGTIIEEFEILASRCVFALVLLTPDDKWVSGVTNKAAFRARQNVVFEMGWFFHRLGRQRTRLIYRGNLDLPSDVTGVTSIHYEKDVNEVREKIIDALRDGGLILPKRPVNRVNPTVNS